MRCSDADINAPSASGILPLETALNKESLSTADRLVKLNANIDVQTSSSSDCVHSCMNFPRAAVCAHLGACRVAAAHSCSPRCRCLQCTVAWLAESLLLQFASTGNEPAVQFLLQHRVNKEVLIELMFVPEVCFGRFVTSKGTWLLMLRA